MTAYAQDIQQARCDIAAAGASIVFTRDTSTYDAATDTRIPSTTTSCGVACRIKPRYTDVMRFQAQGLVLTDPVTLLVAADGLTFDPQPGDTFLWAGLGSTVRSVDPTGPDGTPIFYKVVGSR